MRLIDPNDIRPSPRSGAYDVEYYHDQDQDRAAEGVVNGVLLGGMLWLIIAVVIFRAFAA